MSAPIGPGDLVECIDVSPRPDEPAFAGIGVLQLHARYHVRAVVPGHCCEPAGEDALILEELQLSDRSGAGVVFSISRFRPIRRPNIEVLRSLLTIAPERVTEDA